MSRTIPSRVPPALHLVVVAAALLSMTACGESFGERSVGSLQRVVDKACSCSDESATTEICNRPVRPEAGVCIEAVYDEADEVSRQALVCRLEAFEVYGDCLDDIDGCSEDALRACIDESDDAEEACATAAAATMEALERCPEP